MRISSRIGPPVSIFTALVLALSFLTIADASAGTNKAERATTYVGGDIHTLTYTKNGLILTGHESGSVSKDEGITWKTIPSFKHSDIMAWATTDVGSLAGGHNGLFRSNLDGKSLVRFNFFDKVSDVHALGAAGKSVYIGSPQAGFLSSTDSGKTWKSINQKFGDGFMGSMLVDPANPLRVIAPDMSNGLVLTLDGGKKWSRFGGPTSVMSVDWNRSDTKEIVALGMSEGALTKNNGKSWTTFPVPMGASAVAFSPNGKKILIAILTGQKAGVLVSSNEGKTWN